MEYETYEVRVHTDGTKHWYQNGKQHRLDGPAIEYANGGKCWFQNDKLHRLDGPAIERYDGSKCWFIKGIKYSEEEFNEKVKSLSVPSCDGTIVEIDGKKYELKEVK